MRVLYSVSRIPAWIDCARILEEQLDWSPAYWITLPENHKEVGMAFPELTLHPTHDLNRGLPAVGMETQGNGCLSLSNIIAASRYEAIAMDMMDRVDLGRVFSYQERQRLYHKLLIYWLNVIDTKELKIAIFNVPPHSIGEYVAYTAFQISGLKTRIFRPTPVANLHIVTDRIEKLPGTLKRAYERRLVEENFSCGKQIEDDFSRLENIPDDYRPWYVEETSNREDRWRQTLDKLKDAVANGKTVQEPLKIGEPVCETIVKDMESGVQIIKKDILRRKRKPTHDNLVRQVFKVPGRPISGPLMDKWDFVLYRDWAYLQKLELLKHYERLSQVADLDEKYVYFAMHYQPERTTCPDGGRFNNQFLAISLLSQTLPSDWILYVKEHPSQFNFHSMGELGRWSGYYDEIAQLPNVRFVLLDTPSVELIGKAQAVATITGAVGWEALIKGIPVLCFGAAWYGLCRGAFIIEEYQQALAAFQSVLKGLRPEPNEVRAFAGALEDIGKVVFTNPSLEQVVDLGEPLHEALANLVIQFEEEIQNLDD